MTSNSCSQVSCSTRAVPEAWVKPHLNSVLFFQSTVELITRNWHLKCHDVRLQRFFYIEILTSHIKYCMVV